MTISKCPVCGSAGFFATSHPEATIYRCKACTHVYSDPQTIDQRETYSTQYFQDTHRNWFSVPNLPLFEWILGRIPPAAKSLIDVGCGNGSFLRHVHGKRPDLALTGLDLAENEAADGITFIKGDAVTTEVGQVFDVVVSQAVIEHIVDLDSFTRQLARLCAANGIVVVMTLNNDSLLYAAARLMKRLGIPIAHDRLYSAHHVHHFTTRSLQQALARAGLATQAVHHHDAPLKAVDIPGNGAAVRGVLLAGVAALFFLGRLLGRCYLQTVVAVPTASAKSRG